jgi:hypothetical protein
MGKKSDANDLDRRLRAFEKSIEPTPAEKKAAQDKEARALERELSGLFGGRKRRK